MRFTYKLCRKLVVVAIVLPAITLAGDLMVDDAEWRVVVEDSESYRLGLQRLRAFGEIDPYLGKERSSSVLDRECNPLNRRCLRYLRVSPVAAKAALPDNSDYWHSYLALLAVTPVARLPEEIKELGRGRQDLIQATRLWLLREVLTKDTLHIRDVHFYVQAHRRLLAESNFLIDKMIYTATVGISLPAINVLMAQGTTKSFDIAETRLLEEMLQPLSKEERSYRRALRGEYQLALHRADEYPEIDEIYFDDTLQVFAYVTERSELSWSDYWSKGLDVWADVPLYISGDWLPSWANYSTNTRYNDATLYLLRALREIYDGRASPGIPNQPPPARWHWQWRVDDEELCLEAGYIHHSLDQSHPICLQYLDE